MDYSIQGCPSSHDMGTPQHALTTAWLVGGWHECQPDQYEVRKEPVRTPGNGLGKAAVHAHEPPCCSVPWTADPRSCSWLLKDPLLWDMASSQNRPLPSLVTGVPWPRITWYLSAWCSDLTGWSSEWRRGHCMRQRLSGPVRSLGFFSILCFS